MSAKAETMSRKPSRAGGLTLIELLVAMGLTSLLAVGLLFAARVNTILQRQQGDTQQMQNNARAGLEEITSSVRLAGTTFRAGLAHNQVSTAMMLLPPLPQQIRAIDVINGVGMLPDALNLLIVDDSLTATLLESTGLNPTKLNAEPSAGVLKKDDLFLLSSSIFQTAVLYRLNANPVNVTLNSGAPMFVNYPAVDLNVLLPYPAPPPVGAGGIITRVRLIGYSIDTTIIPGTSMLVLRDGAPLVPAPNAEIIAENIEDLQVAVGIDGLTSGTINGTIDEVGAVGGDDEWVFNAPGEMMPASLPIGTAIGAVRITLISRSSVQEDAVGRGLPAAENRPAGPPDNFRRRVLTTTVAVRAMATN